MSAKICFSIMWSKNTFLKQFNVGWLPGRILTSNSKLEKLVWIMLTCVCKIPQTSKYLWIPEHSMQSSTPRLIEAQHGAAWPQSLHSSLPGRLCTRWRRDSPPPRHALSALSPLSRGSLAESMLLVDGEAVRSKRCRTRQMFRLGYISEMIWNKQNVFCIWLLSDSGLYLNVIVVADVFVSRSDARLDRLDPSLPQLLRLCLQHAAPAHNKWIAVNSNSPFKLWHSLLWDNYL